MHTYIHTYMHALAYLDTQLYLYVCVSQALDSTHMPLSSFLGVPYRILNISHKKELPRGLWVELSKSAEILYPRY